MRVHLASRARHAASVAAALVGILILGIASAPSASAADIPDGLFTIKITKLEQPDAVGAPADGLPIADPTALSAPVAGATFSAWPVPGVDLATNAGQQAAAALTPEDAKALVDTSSVPAASDTTDAVGSATLAGLPAGLYYVVETVTPVGFVGAAPFLVAVPLTNPQTLDGWMQTVHVYPKNARAGITLAVRDAAAVAIGDTVRWTASADVPNRATLDGYTIENVIASQLRLRTGPDSVRVALSGGAGAELQAGGDYDIVVTENGFDVVFTASGRVKLAAAVASDPRAQVTVDYDTVVLGEGELTNRAVLVVTGGGGPVSDTATTKWGPLSIVVHERGKPENLIPGARFKLYLSADDAAAGRNAVVVDGIGEWTTDAEGRIDIHGLRFSGFVDGLERAPGDPLYREYFVIMTYVPEGWTGESRPLGLAVTSTTEPQLAVVELWRAPGGALPVTGGRLAGVGLAVALLTGGILLLAARRLRERREDRARIARV